MIPKKILYCTDFSENSAPAGQYASEYSRVFGADFTIIHVIDCWAGFPGDPHEVLSVVHKIEESAKAELETLATEFDNENKHVKTFSTIGIPAEEIVRLAEKESADLIVMGTHGWTGVRHLLLGSVAEKVLRMALCPVLVVRPAAETAAKE